MQRILFSIALILLATIGRAAITPEELRDLAYAGDVAGAEAAMKQAHAESLSGEITFDELREIQSILINTHPDIQAFSLDWIEAYPDSSYAKSNLAFQLTNSAWNVRGERYISETYYIAIDTFTEMTESAMDIALEAARAAPDYIPATDAVLNLQNVTKRLTRSAHRDFVRTTLRHAPDPGTLNRALRISKTNWGGLGITDIRTYCQLFADMIEGESDYTTDICIVEHLTEYDKIENHLEFATEVLDASDHPRLEYARVELALLRRSDSDRRVVLDYLARPDIYATNMVRKFTSAFPPDRESSEVVKAHNTRDQQRASDVLPHDPFNPSIIKVLLRRYPGYGFANMSQFNWDPVRNLYRRQLIASPYDPRIWAFASDEHSIDPSSSSQHDLYMQNAVHYSYHDLDYLQLFLSKKLEGDHQYRDHIAADDLSAKGNQIISAKQRDTFLLCPVVRLTRMVEYQCEAMDQGPSCASFHRYPYHADILAEVAERDICFDERNAPLETLVYEPVEVDLGDIAPDMANR